MGDDRDRVERRSFRGGALDELRRIATQETRRAHFDVRVRPQRERGVVDGLLAGASEVDITPPPGLPKAGYSANAHDGSGFRTRLRARVLHLRSGTGSIAWVQCDLLGGSAVIAHLVAEAISDHTDIDLGGLMIGATHTHAGPGQFLGTDFYNRFASNRSGFDPEWTALLVERIAEGVVQAHDSRRPAVLATGSCEVWGWTRNRSLRPHVNNDDVADARTEPQRKYVAVNPLMHLVRVDAVDGDGSRPMAATVVFSIHGTGVSMRAHEYNADLWAYVCGELSDRIEAASGHRAVVGAVEGTHADVAPAIRPGLAGYREAERIGRGIGSEAARLWDDLGERLSPDPVVGSALREVDLDEEPSIDGVTLPERPAVGAALVAGAHENLTPVLGRIPPFRAGSVKPWPTRHPQGAKWVLGTRWLQPLVIPKRSFPRTLAVQILRIGPMLAVGLPFEITVESGNRIGAAVRDVVDESVGIERVAVCSVTNEYTGYVATPEEYDLQYYEGGHTLYGPSTQPFLAAHAARLAAEFVAGGDVTHTSSVRTFRLRARRFMPRATAGGAGVTRRVIRPARYVDATAHVDGHWELEWSDVAPGDLCWHEPLVRVEVSVAGGPWRPARHRGRPVDDQGWSLEVTHRGPESPGPTRHRYRVRWYDPAFGADLRHRFVILANSGRAELATAPFD